MRVGITDAFRRYGATLHNVNWSVSAWTPGGSLVVSLWHHHERKGYATDVLAFEDRFDRWSGPGNAEFRRNVISAWEDGADVMLVIVRTVDNDDAQRVQRGDDASMLKKTFSPRVELVVRVTLVDGERYLIEFRRR